VLITDTELIQNVSRDPRPSREKSWERQPEVWWEGIKKSFTPSVKVISTGFTAVISPRDNIKIVLNIHNTTRLQRAVLFEFLATVWTVEFMNKEMGKP
jgi:hypothetical protein